MKTILFVIILFLTFGANSQALTEEERHSAYGMALTKADYLIRHDRFVEALAQAEDAQSLDSSDYGSYYFSAVALYRLRLYDRAETFAKKSSERAPAEKKAMVDALMHDISLRKNLVEKEKQGDEALANGLKNKAAGAYTEAWKIDPAREDLGMKAAGLWCSMSDHVNCVKILRELSQKETETALQAKAMYKSLEPTLYEFARRETESGWHILEGVQVKEGKVEPKPGFTTVTEDDLNEAVIHFSRAADALPVRLEKSPLYGRDMPHVGLAAISAYRKDFDGAIKPLQLAIHDHHLLILPDDKAFFDPPRKYDDVHHPHEPRRIDYWSPLLCATDFQDFLLDAFGTGVVELARDLCREK